MQTSLILQCTLSVEELKLLDEDDIATLVESFDGADPLLKMYTLEAIVDNKNRSKAVDSLIKLLKDEESAVRAKVAWALGKIKDKRAVAPLIKQLKDDSSEVRKSAIRALGELWALGSKPVLVAMLLDNSWEVRSESAVVLEYMNWKPADKAENVLHLIAKEKWEEIVKLEKFNIYILVHFLGDSEKEIGKQIAWSLGEIGNPKAIQPLYDLMMTEDILDVIKTASEALGKIGGERVMNLLHVAIHDANWYVRKCAAETLGTFGTPKSVAPLLEMVDDESLYVQKAVKKVLVDFSSKKDKESE